MTCGTLTKALIASTLWLELEPELVGAGEGRLGMGEGVPLMLREQKQKLQTWQIRGNRENESKCKLTLVSRQEDFEFSEERSERFHDNNHGLTSTAGSLNYICVITWHLTLKWSVRVFEYLMAVLCLWRNMAICKRDWHFKLENKYPSLIISVDLTIPLMFESKLEA